MKYIKYDYRGQIARQPKKLGSSPMLINGYSEQGKYGESWMSYRECQRDAKAQDGKAVFNAFNATIRSMDDDDEAFENNPPNPLTDLEKLLISILSPEMAEKVIIALDEHIKKVMREN